MRAFLLHGTRGAERGLLRGRGDLSRLQRESRQDVDGLASSAVLSKIKKYRNF